MQHSFTTSGHISDDHSLTIKIATDMPPGPVKVTVTFEEIPDDYMPLSMLEKVGILGAWEHRDDLGDSIKLARSLRNDAWRKRG